jgi:DNA-directed RNA polymerase specialized sigma24 family protein
VTLDRPVAPRPPPDPERIERAAVSVSALEREVLVLSAGHGLSTAGIAARLGMSKRRVQRLLASGLRKFDRALEQESRRRWQFW